jgi:hypothetical protein
MSDEPQELLKQRVRVSFDFDITCNTAPIINSGSNDAAKAYDMALLKSFLVADKGKLMMLMVDQIGMKLGYHPESFMEDFLPQVNVEPHELFKPAINALADNEKQFWQEVERDTEIIEHTSCLSLSTEGIFECFEATFKNSSYRLLGEQEHE